MDNFNIKCYYIHSLQVEAKAGFDSSCLTHSLLGGMKTNFHYYSPPHFPHSKSKDSHILGMMSSAPWKAELFAKHIQFTDEIIS
jgi:hypothetical protein